VVSQHEANAQPAIQVAEASGSTLEKSMKKTLLALAAIAATSASFAQSSVTLYGVLDASVESVKGDKTVTRVSSDNLSSSRLGVKGTEDLGDGMKAIFNLEHNVKVDTGAQGNTPRFWDRAAWVGLAGGFGDIRLGRIDSAIGDIAGNVLSAQAYDDLKLLPTRAGGNYRRVDNAITYILPTLVPGLAAELQYSTAAVGYAATGAADSTNVAGTEAAGTSAGKAYGLSLKYAAGPLSAGLGYLNAKDEQSVITGSQKANAALIYAGYDFGVAKVTGYYDAETTPNEFGAALPNSSTDRRMTVLGAKVAVPVSPEFTVITGLSTARNVKGANTGTDNVQIITVKGLYTLSKRTTAYAMMTNVNNDTATAYSLVTPAANDKTTRGLAVGIRHAF
jgi:GBP family porin